MTFSFYTVPCSIGRACDWSSLSVRRALRRKPEPAFIVTFSESLFFKLCSSINTTCVRSVA